MTPFALLSEAEAARLRSLPLTYPAADGVPAGYEAFSRSAVIGHGRAAFAAAVEAVLTWQVQLRSGIAVTASQERVRLGTVARLRVPVGPLRVTAYCRVVEVIDEPDRGGFGYGTLPGHSESGEEHWVVSIHDDVVRLHVDAFSRPTAWYARVGGSVTRRAQEQMTERYLRALVG